MVFKGCTDQALAGGNDVTRTFAFDMPNIKNPYSEKETSPFNIKIFNSWDAASKTGSLQIAGSSTYVIPGTTYATGAITDIKVTAANYIIQEATSQYWQFKVSNEIPGTQDGKGATDIESAIHIRFPSSFSQDPNSQARDVAVEGSGVSITGSPTATIDTSAFYDPQC